MSRILVVEEDPVLQVLYQDMLTQEGHECIVTKNACDAYKAFSRLTPSIIIYNSFCPCPDFFQIISKVRQTDLHIPILLVSEYFLEDVNLIRHHVDQVILKSGDLSELIDFVNQYHYQHNPT